MISEGELAVLPDMRSTVPRMKDNGKGLNPDGDLALGAYQGDAYSAHSHSILGFNNSAGDAYSPGNAAGSGLAARGNSTQVSVYSKSTSNNAFIRDSGENETRAKSTIVNFFIKINSACTFN